MGRNDIPLGDFQRANILQSWELGLTTSEAARAWMRAPDSSLLDNERTQHAYHQAGTDHQGRPLPEAIRGLVHFVGPKKANLGVIAIRLGRPVDSKDDLSRAEPNYMVIRHPRQRTWVALLEEWNYGISIYSRWAHVATIHLEHAPSPQDFALVIQAAQKLSAKRPATSKSGPDYVDPERPSIRGAGEEVTVQPPDIWDRFVGWLREFF